MLFSDICGWIGSICVLAGYLLLSSKLIPARTIFHLLNLVGAIGIAINTYEKHAYPSVVLNVIWMGIAMVALLRRPWVKEASAG